MRIEEIIVHHSASAFGHFLWIDNLHRKKPRYTGVLVPGRGRIFCGYHKIICNGYLTPGTYLEEWDGRIQQGRPDDAVGAHCPGSNSRSLGVCVIGDFRYTAPTAKQWAALVDACVRLCLRHGLKGRKVVGHREKMATICPGPLFPLDRLRVDVRAGIAAKEKGVVTP